MPLLIDSKNIISDVSDAPDRLRAQIGLYYTRSNNGGLRPPRDMSDGRIKRHEIVDDEINDQLLIPTQKHRILIIGDETRFRDFTQWEQYVTSTIQEGSSFLDHQFNFEAPSISYDLLKKFHHPEYEDATKEYPSNQLLNYNLLSYLYRNDVEMIQKIGQLRTKFDSTPPTIERLINEFENRIDNYEGDPEEIDVKQRNVFTLHGNSETYGGANRTFEIFRGEDGTVTSPFPYAQRIDIGRLQSTVNFVEILDDHKKTKNLFQSIKRDLSFNFRNFTTSGGSPIRAKLYNGVSLLTSTSLTNFEEGSDELFLLKGDDVNHSHLSNRFINQLSAIRLLAKLRTTLLDNTKNIHKIFDCNNCEHSLLGYKIEKYLDNDATSPIQTYYTTIPNLVDTQLKYGRKYIYKTKALICVFGSDYRYTNLRYSKPDLEESPTDFQISGDKYWARVDVEVRPSFQILEYQVDSRSVAFVDSPTLAPHVETYGHKNQSCVNFLFTR